MVIVHFLAFTLLKRARKNITLPYLGGIKEKETSKTQVDQNVTFHITSVHYRAYQLTTTRYTTFILKREKVVLKIELLTKLKN